MDEDALKQITQVIFAVNFKEEGIEHWGVCWIELHTERVYFDDGLKLPSPKRLPLYIRQVLSTLKIKFPGFQYNSWAVPDFQRFDMFGQPNGAREVGLPVVELLSFSLFGILREAETIWSNLLDGDSARWTCGSKD